jgi:hypothetical protein
MAEKFNMKDDIFQKDFIIEKPLKEMFSFFGMLINKNKNNVAKLKNQNGGLIQDGDENIFLILWQNNNISKNENISFSGFAIIKS